jgi:hypothetical protein
VRSDSLAFLPKQWVIRRATVKLLHPVFRPANPTNPCELSISLVLEAWGMTYWPFPKKPVTPSLSVAPNPNLQCRLITAEVPARNALSPSRASRQLSLREFSRNDPTLTRLHPYAMDARNPTLPQPTIADPQTSSNRCTASASLCLKAPVIKTHHLQPDQTAYSETRAAIIHTIDATATIKPTAAHRTWQRGVRDIPSFPTETTRPSTVHGNADEPPTVRPNPPNVTTTRPGTVHGNADAPPVIPPSPSDEQQRRPHLGPSMETRTHLPRFRQAHCGTPGTATTTSSGNHTDAPPPQTPNMEHGRTSHDPAKPIWRTPNDDQTQHRAHRRPRTPNIEHRNADARSHNPATPLPGTVAMTRPAPSMETRAPATPNTLHGNADAPPPTRNTQTWKRGRTSGGPAENSTGTCLTPKAAHWED